MSANVFDGKIQVNGQWMRFPFAYFDDYPATKPPFTVTSSGGITRVEYDIYSSGLPELVTTGSDSILCIYNGNAYNEPWRTFLGLKDGTMHKVITLSDGKWIGCYRYAYDSDNAVRLGFYTANDVLIKEEFFGAFTEGNFGYLFITLFVENDTFIAGKLFVIRNENPIRFEVLSDYLIASGANTTFFNVPKVYTDDPYGIDTNQTPSGGYGDYDYSGDDNLPPSLPTLSAAQVGFVSLWNPSQQEMKDLADYLWTGPFDLTNFKKLFTDPMECILSVGIVPVTPTTGTATEIIFGGSSHSGVNAKPITSQFVTVDLGKVHINGQSASALDYSPYVKVSIFLPYCGTYALDADDVMDADVELEYHIDIYTGACVAYLTITKTNSDGSTLHSTLYQFTGNCLASIPITGNDHSQFIQSMLFMGAAVAATVATSGAGAPAIEGAAATGDVVGASAVNAVTASSAVNSVMSMKPNVLRSGNLSSTAGLLGKQKPCITVTWPNLCRPDTEYKLLGMPVHKSGMLSDFEGFTIVSAVHVENILCTEVEKKMIEQMLYKGVVV